MTNVRTENEPKSNAASDVLFVRAPLSEVYVDYGWNGRSKRDVERIIPAGGGLGGFNEERESTGMGSFGDTKIEPGLVELLVLQGQRTPCEARPYDPKVWGESQTLRYALTVGFRRHYALSHIAQAALRLGVKHPLKGDPTWDSSKPTILLSVRKQSNREAREQNIAENTGRSDLPTPDLAFAVLDLYRLLTEENKGREPTIADLGRRINRTAGHAANLLRVMTRLPETVTTHWRTGGEAYIAGMRVACNGSLPLDQIVALAGMPQGTDYETEYVKMVMGSRDEVGNKKNIDERRFERAMRDAAELGELVAFLGHEGIDPAHIDNDDWGRIIEEMVDYDGATADQLDLLARRMSTSYESERKKLADPEDGGGDEEAIERKRQKRDGGR